GDPAPGRDSARPSGLFYRPGREEGKAWEDTGRRSMKRNVFAGAILAMGVLAGCSSEDDKSPYLELRGGGFLFNYRIAEATGSLVLGALRKLPEKSVIEVNFENPAGGAAIILREEVRPQEDKFDFNTPPLKGIVKDKPYAVTIRLLDKDGKELQKIEKPFKSNLDSTVLPDKPLTVGPGYTPNPDLPKKDSSGG